MQNHDWLGAYRLKNHEVDGFTENQEIFKIFWGVIYFVFCTTREGLNRFNTKTILDCTYSMAEIAPLTCLQSKGGHKLEFLRIPQLF